MLGKLIVIAALCAGGYWYWSGPYQEGRQPGGEKQLEENARNMKRCIRRETSINATSGMAGGAVESGGAEKLCAEEYGLYLRDGQWHNNTE